MTNNKSWPKYESFRTLIILVLVGILLNGCVTTKKTSYLQQYEDSPYSTEYVPPVDYLIQPNDNIYLSVATTDPRQSAMFNVMGETAMLTFDEASAQIYSYPVQIDGTIELPYIGLVEVVGKTLEEVKNIIEAELEDYVTDATVTVKLVNNSVTVLGEVVSPGMYPLYKERLNIYQALSLAGDVDVYGDRYTVSIIRSTTEGSIVKEFDLTDRNIIDSEFYYILPNDVVYVKPMKGKFFAMATFPFTLIFAAITTFILLDNYIQQ